MPKGSVALPLLAAGKQRAQVDSASVLPASGNGAAWANTKASGW
jgi:hypothetical protein